MDRSNIKSGPQISIRRFGYRFNLPFIWYGPLKSNPTAQISPYPFGRVFFLKSPRGFVESTRRPVRGKLSLGKIVI
jgi:hypothetical protein